MTGLSTVLTGLSTVKSRGERAMRRGRALGPVSARRNASFWRALADAQQIGQHQSVMRRASSTRYLKALNRLALFAAKAQADHGMGLALGRYSWLDLGRTPAGLDPALGLARAAMGIDKPELAQAFAEQIVHIRPQSRAAWRVLSDALEAQGRREDALRAATRYARLTGATVGPVVESQTQTPPGSQELDALMAAAQPSAHDAATEWYSSLLALHAQQPGARVDDDAARAALSVQPLADVSAASGAARAVLVRALANGRAPALDLGPISAAIVEERPLRPLPSVPREVARAIEPMDAGGLREYLRGKSVCLVANSARVGEAGAGAFIDGYDVVARFNSFRIDPAHTGVKTSLHATIHLHKFNWDVPVDVRLVFSGNANAWRDSVNKYVNSAAQQYLGDASLRWPVRDAALVGDTDLVDVPTSGFNLMRLIDLLDVSTAIDLIGFDFNQSGPFRLDSAMRLPVAKAHDYSAEKSWVLAHATRVDDLVISLR